MSTQSGKRTASVKVTLNKRNVESLKSADKPFIAWDDKLTGFGLRVQPSGVRSYIVNYRAGTGGRKAANRRLVIGRHGRVTADQARRLAQETLGRVAAGDDPRRSVALAERFPPCAGPSRSISPPGRSARRALLPSTAAPFTAILALGSTARWTALTGATSRSASSGSPAKPDGSRPTAQ